MGQTIRKSEDSESDLAAKKPELAAVSEAPNTTHNDSLTNIRQLLFGAELQNISNRNSEFEESINEKIDQLARRFLDKVDILEQFVKSSVESHSEHMRQEATMRLKEDNDLRTLLIERLKTLTDEVHALNEKQNESLKSRIYELDQLKVNRSNLAAVLTEIASSLANTKEA